MIEFLKRRYAGQGPNGRTMLYAEIAVDSSENLPDRDDIDGYRLSVGSVAWVISEGVFYGLDFDGTWVDQIGGEPDGDA